MKITGKTKLLGIFGYPVEHSFSPVMHNKAFVELGLDYCYVPFAVKPELLKTAVDAIKSLGLVGVNVTIPHKEAVVPFLDELSQEARIIGAVNTIINKNGKLTGYNTDGQGFLKSMQLETGVNPQNKKIAIIGAGGAARSVAVQMALAGAEEVIIFNRNVDRANKIAATIKSNTQSKVNSKQLSLTQLAETLKFMDILIDTTPVGMYPKTEEEPVVPKEMIHKNMLVCDLVYNPLETSLIKAAKERGAKVLPGLGMLIHQGALSFELWTGQKAPVDQMKEALVGFLGL